MRDRRFLIFAMALPRTAEFKAFGNEERIMYSILDIDLDYFNLVENPMNALQDILLWAGRPADFIVEKHSHALLWWKKRLFRTYNHAPSHILHVDEHHDMMDEKTITNIGNVMYQVMRTWPKCKVHWLIQDPIDSPAMWLSDTTWKSFRRRFTSGPTIPIAWPRLNLVSVCTSPEFLPEILRNDLLKVVGNHRGTHLHGKSAEQVHEPDGPTCHGPCIRTAPVRSHRRLC